MKRAFFILAMLTAIILPIFAGTAEAGIVIVGDGSDYDEYNMKDWLSYSGSFDAGTSSYNPSTYTANNYVESLPSYVTGHAAGADFIQIQSGNGWGFIDDPTLLDGTNDRSGSAYGVQVGPVGNWDHIMSFTVSGLAANQVVASAS